MLQRGCECLSMTFEGKGEGGWEATHSAAQGQCAPLTPNVKQAAPHHTHNAQPAPLHQACVQVLHSPQPALNQAAPLKLRLVDHAPAPSFVGGFALTPTVCTHTRHTHARHAHTQHKQSTGRARDKRDGRQTKATLQLKLLALLLCVVASLSRWCVSVSSLFEYYFQHGQNAKIWYFSAELGRCLLPSLCYYTPTEGG